MFNIINLTDSYKFSHFNQYPDGAGIAYSYMVARGGEYDEIVFFGIKYYLKEYLGKFCYANIREAEEIAKRHGVPFNREGWNDLVALYVDHKRCTGDHALNTFIPFSDNVPIDLPIKIECLLEGSIAKPGEPLLVMYNTVPGFHWLVGWLETLLLKVWYPTTIATKSYHVKKMLLKHWEKSSDNVQGVDFAYHNFGDRGSSSVESALIGGIAHLSQFKGTDNFNCLAKAKEYYNLDGFSIPATEHSTVTSWGRENEYKMIEHYLETYKKKANRKTMDYNIIACVLDSYDIYKAVNFVTSGSMKEKIEHEDYPVFVIRPDSGDPVSVISDILKIMENNKVAFTINSKGYKVFNKYRIMWGDGITPDTINYILSFITNLGYSAENMAFGSGGDLMQNVNRDTCKFAFKCCAMLVNGQWVDVYKQPITDTSKTSLKGRVTNERFITVYDNGYIQE